MIKVGDSVRLYSNDYMFDEGIITEIDSVSVYTDWGEWISQHTPNDFVHQFVDGRYSWRPLNEGKMVVIKDD